MSPIIILVGIINKVLHPKYPIIYKQTRLGKDEKPFECYKFRTMIDNHNNGKQMIPETQLEFASVFEKSKVTNCKKITRFGALIRKYYIDELPQLYNVLKGDMSLIGPRPNLKYQIDDIRQSHPDCENLLKIRYSAKPGLTGPWQVAPDKFKLSDKEVIQRDIEYIRKAKLSTDLELTWMTILKVLGGAGQ